MQHGLVISAHVIATKKNGGKNYGNGSLFAKFTKVFFTATVFYYTVTGAVEPEIIRGQLINILCHFTSFKKSNGYFWLTLITQHHMP